MGVAKMTFSNYVKKTPCIPPRRPATTCPADAQSTIDSMYSDCDGGADWETEKPAWKALAERKGCAGAGQAVPAALVAAAAVTSRMLSPAESDPLTVRCGAQAVNHFLN